MRMFGIFFIWVVTFGVAGGAFWGYTKFVVRKRPSPHARIDEFEKQWDASIKDAGKSPPPDGEDIVKGSPIGQQHELRLQLDAISKERQPQYQKAWQKRKETLQTDFERAWKLALDNLLDTPTVEEFVKKNVGEHHAKEVQTELAERDKDLKKRNPRTELRLDDFSGYFVLRSEKFRANLETLLEKNPGKKLTMKLHLKDDGAHYGPRLEAVAKGEAPLAVFTLDALINNSEGLKEKLNGENDVPAAAFLLIDETRGADAILAYPNLYAGPEDLANDPELRIVLTGDSPSEMLARLVCDKYGVKKPVFVRKPLVEDVYKSFIDAEPTDHQIYVLWEPWISRATDKKPEARKLIGSEKFPGSIVDVLVVQKKWLKDHRDEVQAITRAYLEARAFYRKSDKDTEAAIRADNPAIHDDKEANKVVGGIYWKTTADNYAQFGLDPSRSSPLPLLKDTIESICKVLENTKTIENVVAIANDVPAKAFYDDKTMAALKEANFNPDASDEWSELIAAKIGALRDEPIAFKAGSTEIKSSGEEQLQEVADLLRKEPKYSLEVRSVIVGDPTEENKKLTKARAEAIVQWLKDKGIAAKRLKPVPVEKPDPKKDKSGVTFLLLEPRR